MSEEQIVFTFNTVNCPEDSDEQIEIFTLEELGIVKGRDYKTIKELEKLLQKEWKKWSKQFISGGFHIYK